MGLVLDKYLRKHWVVKLFGYSNLSYLVMNEKITNRDILKFLHNAQLYSAEPVDQERVEVLSVWANEANKEFKRWLACEEEIEIRLNEHELVFVLVSIAHELQDQIMRKENRRCRPRDSRDMKVLLQEAIENDA